MTAPAPQQCNDGRQRCAANIYKKVNFSRTRYAALGLELIPVYRQSARR